jgi:hypothetical protein
MTHGWTLLIAIFLPAGISTEKATAMVIRINRFLFFASFPAERNIATDVILVHKNDREKRRLGFSGKSVMFALRKEVG